MDEYQLEINEVRRTLARLKADKAEEALIQEYEAELRNLRALYDAARAMYDAADTEPRLRDALADLGFGAWTLQSVYSFVYDAAMATDTGGRDLANVINHTDYAASLLLTVES